MDALRWRPVEYEQQLARHGLSDVGNKSVLTPGKESLTITSPLIKELAKTHLQKRRAVLSFFDKAETSGFIATSAKPI
jgi:hypothetical protein